MSIKVESFTRENVCDKKIILYGCNSAAKLALNVLKNWGAECVAVIDMMYKEPLFEGIPVYRFDQMKNEVNRYQILICAASSFWNIVKTLEEHGIKVVYDLLKIFEEVPIEDEFGEMCDTRKLYEYHVTHSESIEIFKLSVIITEKCSLRCKYCTEYMPYIRNEATHCEFDVFVKSMDALLVAIGKLESVTILGGEAFVNPQWEQFVEYCVKEPRIHKVVLLTNSTIIPKLYICMKHEKFMLGIDDYGNICKKDELVDWAKANGIKYTIYRHEHWFDVSSYEKLSQTKEELKQKFDICQIKGCWNISNGYLYRCTSSYYKMKYMVGIDINASEDYINLLTESSLEIRNHIQQLNMRQYLDACEYCEGTTSKNMIDVAEQLH